MTTRKWKGSETVIINFLPFLLLVRLALCQDTARQDIVYKKSSRIFHPGWWFGLNCFFPPAPQEQLECTSCCTRKQCPHNNICGLGQCASTIQGALPGAPEICFTPEPTSTCTNLQRCKEAGGMDICGLQTPYCVPSRTCN